MPQPEGARTVLGSLICLMFSVSVGQRGFLGFALSCWSMQCGASVKQHLLTTSWGPDFGLYRWSHHGRKHVVRSLRDLVPSGTKFSTALSVCLWFLSLWDFTQGMLECQAEPTWTNARPPSELPSTEPQLNKWLAHSQSWVSDHSAQYVMDIIDQKSWNCMQIKIRSLATYSGNFICRRKELCLKTILGFFS